MAKRRCAFGETQRILAQADREHAALCFLQTAEVRLTEAGVIDPAREKLAWASPGLGYDDALCAEIITTEEDQ